MKSSSLAAVALLLLLGLLAHPTTGTTSATMAVAPDPLAGITVEPMGTVQPAAAPGQTLQMLKLTMEPNSTIDLHHHPGAVVISVVSGQFTTSFADSSAMLSRADLADTEPVESGTDYVLNPGDTVAYDASTTGHVMKNEGTEPLVLIASVLFEDGQPGFIFEDATPIG
jgi:quercetin dioxygenase-like cupin family protein